MMDKLKSILTTNFFIGITSLIAALVSFYLLYIHYNAVAADSLLYKLCSVSSTINCNKVNLSASSELLGIPLAAYGLFFYVFIISGIIISKGIDRETFTKGMTLILLCLSALSVLMIVPLAIISFVVIEASCVYCIVTWVCSIAIFILFIRQKKNSGLKIISSARAFISEYSVSWQAGLLAFVTAALAVSILMTIFSYKSDNEKLRATHSSKVEEEVVTQFLSTLPINIDTKNLPVFLGKPDAKVAIVEYINFDCFACRKSFPVMHEISKKYPNSVKIYLKNYPIDAMCNPNVKEKRNGLSCMSSLISIGLRGKKNYPAFINGLMSSERLDPQNIFNTVKSVGLDNNEADKYVKDQAIIKKLLDEIDDAKKFGISATPTYIINGKVLKAGYMPVHLLERIIDMELAKTMR
jgi:protein-disulfide isomerase/uncharacterized membrane protein